MGGRRCGRREGPFVSAQTRGGGASVRRIPGTGSCTREEDTLPPARLGEDRAPGQGRAAGRQCAGDTQGQGRAVPKDGGVRPMGGGQPLARDGLHPAGRSRARPCVHPGGGGGPPERSCRVRRTQVTQTLVNPRGHDHLPSLRPPSEQRSWGPPGTTRVSGAPARQRPWISTDSRHMSCPSVC